MDGGVGVASSGSGTPSSVYVDPLLRRQKIEDMPPEEFLSIPISDLNQTGPLYAGSAAKRDVAASILGVALPKLDRRDQDDIARAKKYAMEQSIKYVLMKQTLAHQQQQAKSLQRHQALVLMCRVYIGSISFELREDTIRQAFAPFGPIKTINMSWDPVAQKHKGFAFVEYDLPEAAQLALEQMNGVMIGGRNIKCGRDTRIKFSHMDQVIEDLMEEAKVYHRIYVASIHPDLTEDDIKSVFEAFGKIKACKLAPGPNPGKHRGYGFIEYELAQSAGEAIASMNLFDLGGQYLRVGKAITPPNALQVANPGQSQMPTAAAVAAAAATAKIQAMEAVTNTAAALGLTKEEATIVPSNVVLPASMTAGFVLAPPPTLAPVGPPPLMSVNLSGFSASPKLGSAGIGSFAGSSQMGMTSGFSLATAPVLPSGIPPPGVAVPTIGLGGFSGVAAPTVVAPTLGHLGGLQHMQYAAGFTRGPTAAIPPPTVVQTLPLTISGVPSISQTQASTSYAGGPIKAPITAAELAAASIKEDLAKQMAEESENMSLSSQENVSIKGQSARHLVMQKLMRNESSSIIVLKNMVSPEDVDDTLQEEITDECSNYGNVVKVIIYNEKESEEEQAPSIVKIFVEFTKPQEAEAARSSLNGRFFGGRRVICEIYDYQMYKIHDLSG